MFKKHIITLATIAGVVISAFAFADIDKPDGLDLEHNEEYQRLLAESDSLMMREDSLRSLIAETRDNMRLYIDTLTTEPSREFINKYNSRIVELEEEMFNLNTKQGVIASRINTIELAAIESRFNTSIFDQLENEIAPTPDEQPESEVANSEATATEMEREDLSVENGGAVDTETEAKVEIADIADTTVETETETEIVRSSNIADSEIFGRALSEEDLADLRTAQQSEAELESITEEYLKHYAMLNELISAYDAAANQQSADPIYEQIATTADTLDRLNTEISRKWNDIIDTKYYAYGYVIEIERNKELLGKLDNDFSAMLQHCTDNDNLYASNGLMRYALGRPAIIDFEIALTSAFGLTEACDSLQGLKESLNMPNYQLAPIELPERRLFIDYRDISFGRTNFYNEDNPLPELKVYERGTIYRILLGVFKSRQPMTLFKGVQPLYIEKDSQGMNSYYAGGFATLEEAEAAQSLLFEKGFKGPEICFWRDGVMTNISTPKSDAEGDAEVALGATRYMLRVANDDMSDAIRSRINQEHPNKSITLTSNGYIIGSFDNHDEVTRLYITLDEEFNIDTEILEIEIK